MWLCRLCKKDLFNVHEREVRKTITLCIDQSLPPTWQWLGLHSSAVRSDLHSLWSSSIVITVFNQSSASSTAWPLLPWAVLLYCSPGSVSVWHQSPLPPKPWAQKVTHAWVSLPFHLLPAEVWGNFLRVVHGEREREARRSPALLFSLILSGKSNGSLQQQPPPN